MSKKYLCRAFTGAVLSLLLIAAAAAPAGAETFWDHFEWDSAEQADAFYLVPEIPLPIVGDLDNSGTLEPADARLALRFSIGLEPLLEEQHALYLADRDGDGKATPADARLILRAAVGLTNFSLPAVDNDVYRIRTHGLGCEYDDLGTLKALEVNAGTVTDIFGEHLPLWRVDSMETLAKWTDAFGYRDLKNGVPVTPYQDAFAQEDMTQEISDAERSLSGPVDADVLAFLKRYDSDFFAENDLFICCKCEGSGSYAQAVYVPTLKDGVLTLKVSTAYYENAAATCDMANWLIFIPVSKELTKIENGCNTFDCLLGEQVALPEGYEYFTENSFDNWLWTYSCILTENAEATVFRGTGYTFSLLNGQDGGYIWEYDADEGLIVSEAFVTYPANAPGTPSLQRYSVTADKPGTYTMRFRLKRSWETDSIAERTVTVTVK